MPWSTVVPVLLDCPPGDLCSRPYAAHSRGCPNFGKRATCPPQAFRWTPEYIASNQWVAIWIAFEFGEHVDRMRKIHPDWSQRQLECCLYWQGTARKRLHDAVDEFLQTELSGSPVTTYYVPEAHGCNVTATMATLGVALEWPPKVTTRHVALVQIARDDT